VNIPDTFSVSACPITGERIVVPSFGVGNSSWQDYRHRWLRSMHLDSNDRIISLGFPKFMNLNEGVETYKVTENDLLENAGKGLYATLKIDGSLLVRFVHNGKVRFRTRGSLRVGLDNAFEIDVFCEKYPKLINPNWFPDFSLLFEWVSPANRIVIRYDEPKLFLLGAVKFESSVPWWNANPKLLETEILEGISQTIAIEMFHYYDLNSTYEVTKLINDLKSNTEIEGFVLRFHRGQKLVKVKADHYLTLHALRSRLTTELLIDLWLQWERPDFEGYRQKFETLYDYECWMWAMPAVSSMFDGLRDVLATYEHIKKFVEANRGLVRKDFALAVQQKWSGLKLSACFMMLDNKIVSDDFWKKLILQNTKQVEMRMFKSDDDFSES